MANDFPAQGHEYIICRFPASLAPELIRHRPGPTAACYFHKQPPSETELNKRSRQ